MVLEDRRQRGRCVRHIRKITDIKSIRTLMVYSKMGNNLEQM